jgi:hypothetical protein
LRAFFHPSYRAEFKQYITIAKPSRIAIVMIGNPPGRLTTNLHFKMLGDRV